MDRMRCTGARLAAAQSAIANSGCAVASPSPVRLRSSTRTCPSGPTSRAPKGSSPWSSASPANSTQRASRCRSVSLSATPASLGVGVALSESGESAGGVRQGLGGQHRLADTGDDRGDLQRLEHHLAAEPLLAQDRKSTRLNSSHVAISYAVFCLKKNKYPLSGERKTSYYMPVFVY